MNKFDRLLHMNTYQMDIQIGNFLDFGRENLRKWDKKYYQSKSNIEIDKDCKNDYKDSNWQDN